MTDPSTLPGCAGDAAADDGSRRRRVSDAPEPVYTRSRTG